MTIRSLSNPIIFELYISQLFLLGVNIIQINANLGCQNFHYLIQYAIKTNICIIIVKIMLTFLTSATTKVYFNKSPK